MRTWGGRLERPILGLRNLSKARGWEKQQSNDPEDPATSSIHTNSISMAFAGDCRTVQGVMCGMFVFHYSLALRNASRAARRVACQGVRSHPVPVALVGECSIPVA